MSRKRKCIVILLFIVLVTILFILYNRSQFFLGISYHCKYSVYEVHSKSFKNHSNLPVNHRTNASIVENAIKKHRKLVPIRHKSKLTKKLTTTDLPPLLENTLEKQKLFVFYTGLTNPRNVTKYKDCPEGRVLTILFTGRLGNVIWEYMSLIAVEELYNDQLNMHAYVPGTMRRVLQLLFKEIDTPEIVDLPSSCIGMRHAQLVRRNEKPKYDPRLPYNSPIILDAFSCRYKDVFRYGFDKFRQKLQIHEQLTDGIGEMFTDIKIHFNFSFTENVTFIGVHYRGQEYNTMLSKGPPSFRYYENAMKYFNTSLNQVIFIVISADKEWLNDNIPHIKNFNIVVNPIGNNSSSMVPDFATLSLCNHSVINYGTYAATSALFAGGTTIVYDTNLPRDGRGYTLASSIVPLLPNWILCNETKCPI